MAVRLASYFFTLKNAKTTPAMMRMSIGQARNLINAGYTENEISDCILYTFNHPPRSGFKSIGWLSYTIADTLNKVKVMKMKQEQIEKPKAETTLVDVKELNKNKVSKENATRKMFNLDMFK